jgi:hypothetical protein
VERSLKIIDDAAGNRVVRARLTDNGTLSIEGQDFNGGEYEWIFRVNAEDIPDVIRALGGNPNDDPLALLAERTPHLPDRGSHDPGGWLRAAGVPGEFWSHFDFDA